MGTRSLGTNEEPGDEEPGDKGTLYTYHTQLQPHTFSIPDDIILVTPPPAQPAGGLQCTTHGHNRTHMALTLVLETLRIVKIFENDRSRISW